MSRITVSRPIGSSSRAQRDDHGDDHEEQPRAKAASSVDGFARRVVSGGRQGAGAKREGAEAAAIEAASRVATPRPAHADPPTRTEPHKPPPARRWRANPGHTRAMRNSWRCNTPDNWYIDPGTLQTKNPGGRSIRDPESGRTTGYGFGAAATSHCKTQNGCGHRIPRATPPRRLDPPAVGVSHPQRGGVARERSRLRLLADPQTTTTTTAVGTPGAGRPAAGAPTDDVEHDDHDTADPAGDPDPATVTRATSRRDPRRRRLDRPARRPPVGPGGLSGGPLPGGGAVRWGRCRCHMSRPD